MTNIKLPDVDDRDAIVRFAGEFNAYEHWGSFNKAVGRGSKRKNLIDLKTEFQFFVASGCS